MAAAATTAGAPAAHAVTNGQADEGRHPYVGALVTHDKHDRKRRLICSGTLISTTVFLTAAHCLLDEPANLYVSFDPFVGAPDVGPGVTLHPGTAVGHLSYRDSTAPGDTYDIGVVRLDPPVEGIAPATLPRPDTLGKLDAAGKLRDTSMEVVGYGREGYDGKRFFGGGGRRLAFGAFGSLEPFKLNTDQSGTIGGSCNGDSGGPILLGGTNTVLAIISDGDPYCQVNGINYRVDTESARDFLDDFTPVPPPSAPGHDAGRTSDGTEFEPSGNAPETQPVISPATPGAGFEPEPVARGSVLARFSASRRGARVRALRVRALAPGAQVQLSCKARRGKCPFSVRNYNSASRLALGKAFRRRTLRPGTVVTVRITGVSRRARVVSFTVKRGRVVRR